MSGPSLEGKRRSSCYPDLSFVALSEEIQIKGRTGRQDDDGSYEKILLKTESSLKHLDYD
eukprot:CAMPEP_0115039526 /NCGR_PEP_ID=MMETSP0216-20121206/44098_1 /TAXON_ID=223996 /ORGANISM="Protocruzia adherens, Strain Boccale" /LENGTH=59 /DNA_ID=CAMNT_0002420217 /DNA_START=1 /DNA_END=177 /DNA_ORIENTATION=-